MNNIGWPRSNHVALARTRVYAQPTPLTPCSRRLTTLPVKMKVSTPTSGSRCGYDSHRGATTLVYHRSHPKEQHIHSGVADGMGCFPMFSQSYPYEPQVDSIFRGRGLRSLNVWQRLLRLPQSTRTPVAIHPPDLDSGATPPSTSDDADRRL